MARHSRWPGAASSAPVSRSRAMPTRGRRSKPSPPLSALKFKRRREPSRRLGSAPPRPCGPLCRPEVGVPSRPSPPPSALCTTSVSSSGDGSHPDGWGQHRRGPAGRRADQRSAFQAVPATFRTEVQAETGAIPTVGVSAAAALRAAVPTRGRRSKPSPPSAPLPVRSANGLCVPAGPGLNRASLHPRRRRRFRCREAAPARPRPSKSSTAPGRRRWNR